SPHRGQATGSRLRGSLVRSSSASRAIWSRVYQPPLPDAMSLGLLALLLPPYLVLDVPRRAFRGFLAVCQVDGRAAHLPDLRPWPGQVDPLELRYCVEQWGEAVMGRRPVPGIAQPGGGYPSGDLGQDVGHARTRPPPA